MTRSNMIPPMRILVLGWARLSAQQSQGSGSNLAASELAAGLAGGLAAGWEAGMADGHGAHSKHRVEYLRSGMTYSLRRGMRIRRLESWRGVRCFDLVNSPNLATGNFNLRNVECQIDHPAQRELILRFVAKRRPDVVHIQSLEGLPFSIIPAMRAMDIRVVLTPHNYYCLCPQVDLLHQEREICTDYAGGMKCPECLWHAPKWEDEFRRRQKRGSIDRVLGAGAFDTIRHTRDAVIAELRDPIASLAHETSGPRVMPVQALPPPPSDVNDRLLSLPVLDDHVVSVHRRIANAYGLRRERAIAALNEASIIACPSRFLLQVHRAMGVREERLKFVPLGQPHFDAIRNRAIASADFQTPRKAPSVDRPLRLRYFGNCYPLKGLATLIAALPLIPQDTQRIIRLSIHASGDNANFRAAADQFPWVRFEGGYEIRDLPRLLNDTDLTLFPNAALENSPFVILESLHSGTPVLVSDLGASPDWVDRRNGGRVRANDPQAWADAIASWAAGSGPSKEEVHSASALRSFGSYLEEMESLLSGA